MQCRHTVPDWHRYVNPAAATAPIFAACRLLVREEEPAGDPRRIACTYWGHQRDCPLYEGPGAREQVATSGPAQPSPEEIPVAAGAVWPVRPPGAKDGMRLVLIGLGLVSTALLAWAVLLGLSVLGGKAASLSHLHLTLVAATVSIVTHVLALLRTWARR